MLDQEFWATQISKLNIGINGGCFYDLSCAKLEKSIQRLLTSGDALRKNSVAISKKIGKEDGIGKACSFVEKFLAHGAKCVKIMFNLLFFWSFLGGFTQFAP